MPENACKSIIKTLSTSADPVRYLFSGGHRSEE
jgi:hypothetical protein